MSAIYQNADKIKQSIYEELSAILSGTSEVRVHEEKLKALKFTEGYGVFLAEIIVTQSYELPVRQLASVMLKQYVEEHWCQDPDSEDDFSKLIVNEQAKKIIKSMLPDALYDPNSKLRNTVAYTISTIASSDWPTDWAELFEIIVKCLGGNDDSIHGAMQVLIEFTMDLNSQISTVAPLILSEVYRIFEADKIYSVRTRTSTVEILNSLLKSINTHIESKQERAALLDPILGLFVQKLIIGLTVPNGQFSNFALKTEIIKVFTYMINEMPKFINTYIDEILPPMWQLLTAMADIYIKTIVNNSEQSPMHDTDEEQLFIKMVLQTFEFVHSIIESKKFKGKVAHVLTDLVYIIIIYLQMTEEQIETWSDDPEKFVEDEDEEGVDFNVRTSVQDVLLMVGKEFEDIVLCALNEALTKHCAVAEASRAASSHWWKIHESSMLAVGSLKMLILENPAKFDVSQYLNMVKNFIDNNASPFLLGRILWLFSSYAESETVYNLQMLEQVLNTTITCLMPDKPCPLKISSARAVFNFCTNLKDAPTERRELVKSKLEPFFEGIMSMMGGCQNTVLGLLMETISAIIQFDEHFTGTIANKVISLTIAVFLKHDDRFILELVQEVLKTLSQNQYCLEPLQVKIVPTLVSILNLQDKQPLNSSLPDAMQDIALDILQTILQYSKAPLSPQMIDVAFPAAVNCILRTDDHSVMQSGGECLRAFLYASPQQVCEYKNGEGLNYVMQVATMLLNPRNTEYSASFVGRLIITIITKAGIYLGESIDLLLKAVISKMQLVESLSVIMSLCMIFAHLIIIQMDAVINFLSTVPGPTGEPAIKYVFTNWLSRQHLFYGAYERKVSIVALCKLFEYGVTSKDQRLTSVMLKEPVANPQATQTRTTRSQTATQQWKDVSILVKIFKLLLNELANLKEMKNAEIGGEEDSSNEDESFCENGEAANISGKNFSAYMLDFDEDEDTNEDDKQMMAELMQDPIFQTDMEENLTKFIQNFTCDENFKMFFEQLNDAEKALLQSVTMK